METLFEDDFVNGKFLSFMKAKIEQEQLDKTIDEIDYLNKVQSHSLDKTINTIKLNK